MLGTSVSTGTIFILFILVSFLVFSQKFDSNEHFREKRNEGEEEDISVAVEDNKDAEFSIPQVFNSR